MVSRGQRVGSLRQYSRLSRQEPLLFYQVAPQLYSRGWVDPVPYPLLLRKSGSAGNRTRTSGSVAKKLWLLTWFEPGSCPLEICRGQRVPLNQFSYLTKFPTPHYHPGASIIGKLVAEVPNKTQFHHNPKNLERKEISLTCPLADRWILHPEPLQLCRRAECLVYKAACRTPSLAVMPL
jgi:hypothetical protein